MSVEYPFVRTLILENSGGTESLEVGDEILVQLDYDGPFERAVVVEGTSVVARPDLRAAWDLEGEGNEVFVCDGVGPSRLRSLATDGRVFSVLVDVREAGPPPVVEIDGRRVLYVDRPISVPRD